MTVSPDRNTTQTGVFPARTGDSLQLIRGAANPNAVCSDQLSLARRIKTLLPQLHDLRALRIALLGNGTLSFFADVVRLWLALEGFQPEIYVSAYNSYRQEILNPNSALYSFQPDIVWLFVTERDVDLRYVPLGATGNDCDAAIADVIADWRNLWGLLRSQLPAFIIQNNFEMPALRLFGQLDGGVPWSRRALLENLNSSLREQARAHTVTLFDLHYSASTFGLSRWHEQRYWHNSKQPFAPDAYGLVAFQFARFVGAMKGRARKCIALDLDNTLWGGVIGDDGIDGICLDNDPEGEAFVAFQEYLKNLASRGILLAVCSKNEEALASEVFLRHPAMRLRLEDIACFRANWENKVDNLREIAATLNIGLDSFVFVDDNPVERALIRAHLPEVAVPEMPADPSEFPAVLDGGRYFDAATFSAEDTSRVRMYKDNGRREAARISASDVNEYLQSLEMEAESGPADSFHLPRMAQLLSKTNQFHPTTTRHNEVQLAPMAADCRNWVRWFSLRDRFGDHGLVSVVVMLREGDDMLIDSWAMSCRVFSRGLEHHVFEEMVRASLDLGARRLIGCYIATERNKPVADLYQRLGFVVERVEEGCSRWAFDLSAPRISVLHFIKCREQSLA